MSKRHPKACRNCQHYRELLWMWDQCWHPGWFRIDGVGGMKQPVGCGANHNLSCSEFQAKGARAWPYFWRRLRSPDCRCGNVCHCGVPDFPEPPPASPRA